MNIPIYRAKKIDSDEYVLGQPTYIPHDRDRIIMHVKLHEARLDVRTFEIDPSTLSISFPDMLDSEGNKIFASLSEDGRGGDLISHKGEFLESKEDLIAIYKYGSFRMSPLDFRTSFKLVEWVGFTVKVIGIKE